MEARYNKNRYSARPFGFAKKEQIIFGKDFKTLKEFRDEAKNRGWQISFDPMYPQPRFNDEIKESYDLHPSK